jgi:hypothetical protein
MRKVDDIMSNNAKKDDVIVLGGRELKRVKNGLDEAEVASFIDGLVEERDKLAQSQEHIASLTRLAETTVVEADNLATQIKTETAEQAKAESTAITDKAREQARQMMEQKIAEAEETANERANVIKAKAEEEAVLLLENQKTKIRGELHNLVNQQFGYMLDELESLKRQAAAVQADFGNKLSEPGEEKSNVTTKIAEERDNIVAEAKEVATVEIAKESDVIVEEKKEAAALEITEERGNIVAEEIEAAAVEITEERGNIVAEEIEAAAVEITEERGNIVAEEKEAAAVEFAEERDNIVTEEKEAPAVEFAEEGDKIVVEEKEAAAVEFAEESRMEAGEENKALDKSPEPRRATDHPEKSFELSKLLQFEEQAELGKPQWEVEILPPFNVAKVMEVVAFLDQLPEVTNTEMIVPKIDMPSILVFLREPINFVNVLQTIPAVAYIEEVKPDTAATNGDSRKVRIALSGTTTSQEKK